MFEQLHTAFLHHNFMCVSWVSQENAVTDQLIKNLSQQ